MLSLLITLIATAMVEANPVVLDSRNNVIYQGFIRNGLEVFLGIPYGQDTGGQNRFKPPQLYVPTSNSTINATAYGLACPQPTHTQPYPLGITLEADTISENCLNLNIIRPNNTGSGSALPVMVYIYGGSFWTGANSYEFNSPDGLVLESIENQLPVIHIAMNYRIGAFGFAQSAALQNEGSENAGLRDQRLALEWVQNNVQQFGGDPERVTIHGQSSGGLSVGMQVLAYGGSKPAPFQAAICESQALEPGITGNFTYNMMQLLVNAAGCNTTDLNSNATIQCLRNLDMHTLLNASVKTYSDAISNNDGDCWLPTVDGDFLPAAPSELLVENRFANVTTMILWCEDDTTIFTNPNITTAADTLNFITQYLPGMSNTSVNALLDLYPISEFQSNPSANLSAQFYRSARIVRDVLMTCQPIHFGTSLAQAGNDVYLVDQNQTMLDEALAYVGQPGQGVCHTSEWAYTFGNISHYNTSGWPFNPTPDDYRLQTQESRSWSTFAAVGQPSLTSKNTLQGMDLAFAQPNQTYVFVVGGATEGLSAFDGVNATAAVAAQRLRERCGFLNSAAIIPQLQY